MRLSTSLAALALVAATPAFAQFGNPGFMVPGTRAEPSQTPPADVANTSDRVFAVVAAIGGMAEVEFARLAQNKGRSDEVEAFARRMVEDHTKANEKLAAIAGKLGIVLPAELDPAHKAVRAELEKLSGPAFDAEYMGKQVGDHQQTVQLLEYELSAGQNAELVGFAKETLPIVLDHLAMARDILAELRASAPQANAGAGAAPRAAPRPAPQAPAPAKK